MNLIEKDAYFLGRGSSMTPIHAVKTQGCKIIDADGKTYIDFLMGWCVGNLGWHHPEIRAQMRQYDGPEYVQPAFLYEPWVALAELLAKITPGDLRVSFRATGGTEAVEIALQAAMAATKRSEFVSIEGAYHGHSIGAMSVGASDFKIRCPNLLSGCHKLLTPLDDRAADQLESILKEQTVAALIMEPIICNLGVEIPSDTFMQRAATLCKKYGTLLIMDEVMTGFMRTGKMFASEHFSITPDILCMAKGLSGGYGALGATIMTEKVAQSMQDEFSFYSTFGWHPFAVAAALENIAYIESHKTFLEKNIDELHHYFVKRLHSIKFQGACHVHAKGLAMAAHFEEKKYANQLIKKARDAGLFISLMGHGVIAFFPALTMDLETAKQGLDILESIA